MAGKYALRLLPNCMQLWQAPCQGCGQNADLARDVEGEVTGYECISQARGWVSWRCEVRLRMNCHDEIFSEFSLKSHRGNRWQIAAGVIYHEKIGNKMSERENLIMGIKNGIAAIIGGIKNI